jgi:acetylornithine aminotransferase apoenzyme (EC 2.6.1.11)
VGRTGSFFAYQGYDVTPDIVTLAKQLGGGFPIGAMLASNEAASGFAPGDHASTFGGNPLAAATARRLVKIVSQPAFLKEVRKSGQALHDKLTALTDNRIAEVRAGDCS